MPPALQVQKLFQSSSLTVSDVRCRPDCPDCGGEEHATEHLLVFPRRGVFVKRVARAETVADSTQLLFFNRHEPYRVAHPVPGGDDCTALAFDPAALLDFVRRLDPSVEETPTRPFRLTAVAGSFAATLTLQRLRQHLRSGAVEALAVEEVASRLLESALAAVLARTAQPRLGRRVDTRKAHQELAHNACLVLAGRFQQKLSLGELARAVHSSPFHLARVFRRETGSTLHRHQTRLRLGAALERLLDSAPDLTGLALDLGFSSHAHFSDVFRRECGVAPSALRRRLSAWQLRELSKVLKAKLACAPHAGVRERERVPCAEPN